MGWKKGEKHKSWENRRDEHGRLFEGTQVSFVEIPQSHEMKAWDTMFTNKQGQFLHSVFLNYYPC